MWPKNITKNTNRAQKKLPKDKSGPEKAFKRQMRDKFDPEKAFERQIWPRKFLIQGGLKKFNLNHTD